MAIQDEDYLQAIEKALSQGKVTMADLDLAKQEAGLQTGRPGEVIRSGPGMEQIPGNMAPAGGSPRIMPLGPNGPRLYRQGNPPPQVSPPPVEVPLQDMPPAVPLPQSPVAPPFAGAPNPWTPPVPSALPPNTAVPPEIPGQASAAPAASAAPIPGGGPSVSVPIPPPTPSMSAPIPPQDTTPAKPLQLPNVPGMSPTGEAPAPPPDVPLPVRGNIPIPPMAMAPKPMQGSSLTREALEPLIAPNASTDNPGQAAPQPPMPPIPQSKATPPPVPKKGNKGGKSNESENDVTRRLNLAELARLTGAKEGSTTGPTVSGGRTISAPAQSEYESALQAQLAKEDPRGPNALPNIDMNASRQRDQSVPGQEPVIGMSMATRQPPTSAPAAPQVTPPAPSISGTPLPPPAATPTPVSSPVAPSTASPPPQPSPAPAAVKPVGYTGLDSVPFQKEMEPLRNEYMRALGDMRGRMNNPFNSGIAFGQSIAKPGSYAESYKALQEGDVGQNKDYLSAVGHGRQQDVRQQHNIIQYADASMRLLAEKANAGNAAAGHIIKTAELIPDDPRADGTSARGEFLGRLRASGVTGPNLSMAAIDLYGQMQREGKIPQDLKRNAEIGNLLSEIQNRIALQGPTINEKNSTTALNRVHARNADNPELLGQMQTGNGQTAPLIRYPITGRIGFTDPNLAGGAGQDLTVAQRGGGGGVSSGAPSPGATQGGPPSGVAPQQASPSAAPPQGNQSSGLRPDIAGPPIQTNAYGQPIPTQDPAAQKLADQEVMKVIDHGTLEVPKQRQALEKLDALLKSGKPYHAGEWVTEAATTGNNMFPGAYKMVTGDRDESRLSATQQADQQIKELSFHAPPGFSRMTNLDLTQYQKTNPSRTNTDKANDAIIKNKIDTLQVFENLSTDYNRAIREYGVKIPDKQAWVNNWMDYNNKMTPTGELYGSLPRVKTPEDAQRYPKGTWIMTSPDPTSHWPGGPFQVK